MITSGLAAPTQSGAGIAAATASPAVSYAIGQHFKDLAGQNTNGKLTASQETAHVLAHAVLGAAVAAAGDNNALAGALSAGGSEAAAPYISKWLYGKEKGSDLTAEEKETVTAITNLLGTVTGAAVGNSATDGAQGSLNAQSAVGNNDTVEQVKFALRHPRIAIAKCVMAVVAAVNFIVACIAMQGIVAVCTDKFDGFGFQGLEGLLELRGSVGLVAELETVDGNAAICADLVLNQG